MNIKLEIEGMTCGHCQKAVDSALKSVQGVKHVMVSLEQKSAVVEGEADLSALIQAVQDEGYTARTAV